MMISYKLTKVFGSKLVSMVQAVCLRMVLDKSGLEIRDSFSTLIKLSCNFSKRQRTESMTIIQLTHKITYPIFLSKQFINPEKEESIEEILFYLCRSCFFCGSHRSDV